MSYPTVTGDAVEGLLYREAQSCLGPAIGAAATYQFLLSGTSTPANVYQDGALATPFPITGFVTADNFGRFPPIYLDPSVIYKVQFFDTTNTLRWTVDPYTSTLSTVGTSVLSAFGFQIATTGEVIVDAPNSGGTGIALTLRSGALGTAALELVGTLAGNSSLIVNNSATTGVRTATFTATNKPGTATSAPAGWLPITCDGVQYYTPIWHGNPFTPYVANPAALGETIVAQFVTFTGAGLTTVVGGTATPSNWFSPLLTNIGASYYINITKTGGLSGLIFDNAETVTAAPSGATYTGGTLTANWPGQTASNYVIVLSTGQVIAGCTFTNGSAVFTTPSTNIAGTPTTSILISVQGQWINITSAGLIISSNAQATINGTYQLSNSITGSPVVATGTITLSGNNGIQSPTYNGAANLVLAGNGTATLSGVSSSNWFAPTTSNIGASYWIKLTQTGGTSGTTFTAASTYTNITNGGLTIGISGGTGVTNATGTYIIASGSGGVNQLGSGTITLTGGTLVQSPNWSGTTPLVLAGNGSTTLNGSSTSSWYSPNAANVGSGYWINITRTSGVSGVNFSAAQGSWTNITNSGLSIGMTGYTGDVGTVTVGGTYNISSSATGSPVLGSGTISLSINAGTITHTYTAGTGATETVPTNSSFLEIILDGAGASGASSTSTGGGGGGSGEAHSTGIAVSGGQTLTYTIGAPGAGVGFTPTARIYTTGSGATETAPAGATNVVIECWGGSAGGGGGVSGTGLGTGGGSGGYSRTSVAISGGQTLQYTVGAAGAAGASGGGTGGNGGASSVSSGTKTITTMTCNGATGAVFAGSSTGGFSSGGTVTNLAGGGVGAGTRTGAIPQPGVNASGNAGGTGGTSVPVSAGTAGGTGVVCFYYTGGSNGNASGASSVTGNGGLSAVSLSVGAAGAGLAAGTGGAGSTASGGNSSNTSGSSGATGASGGKGGNSAAGAVGGTSPSAPGTPGAGSGGAANTATLSGATGKVQFKYT